MHDILGPRRQAVEQGVLADGEDQVRQAESGLVVHGALLGAQLDQLECALQASLGPGLCNPG